MGEDSLRHDALPGASNSKRNRDDYVPPVLRTLFPAICSLSAYLEKLGYAQANASPDVEFLESIMVVRCSDTPVPSVGPPGDVHFSQAEVVHMNIEKILKAATSTTPNLLTLGYRNLRAKGNRVVGAHGIENYFPNTIINILKAECWQNLLRRIGFEMMCDLLLNTTMFLCMPNGCVVQLTGIPLTDQSVSLAVDEIALVGGLPKTKSKRQIGDNNADEGPSKKIRNQAIRGIDSLRAGKPTVGAVADPNNVKAPGPQTSNSGPSCSILIARRKIFSVRGQRNATGGFLFGLPKFHILNRGKASFSKTRLLADIFPNQFGSRNAFRARNGKEAGDYGGKDLPDSSAMGKVPRRLKTVGDLGMQMQALHDRCNYSAILDFYCPKTSGKPSPQPSATFDASSSFHQVSSFVRAIIQKVIPNALWGSPRNQKVILQAVDKFLRLRRYETMSLRNIVHRFKINECEWAHGRKGNADISAFTPLSETFKRTELVYEFLFWVFDGFVIPLLRGTFYVTESAPFRNKIFYFRHDLWHNLTDPVFQRLSTTIFEPLQKRCSHEDTLKCLGYSYIRLLPKESGVRMITNLRRRISSKKISPEGQNGRPGSTSINGILQNAFHILTYEKTHREMMGGSVSGLNDIYARLKEFRDQLVASSGSRKLPTLFFCKVDVANAFDTIDQGLLLQIIRDVLQEDEYLVQKFSLIHQSAGRYKKSFIRKARPSGEFKQFTDFAKEVVVGLRNTIVVDQVVHSFEERDTVITLLEQHIENNLIKVGKRLFRQISGIPQGSILSTILCSFFYAHLEQEALRGFSDENSALLRYVDDFLYITTDRANAVAFVRTMHAGHPRHGCRVNVDKTLTNFPLDLDGCAVKHVGTVDASGLRVAFPWCGLLIDTESLQVRGDFGRFQGLRLDDTLTVEIARTPGRALKHKLMQMLKPKCHAIFLDASLNSLPTVIVSVYDNLRLCAMKFVAYVRLLGFGNALSVDVFLHRVIRDVVRFAYLLIRSRVSTLTARTHGCVCPLTATQIEWLGLKAFHSILHQKQTRFPHLTKQIRKDGEAARFATVRKRLLPIVALAKVSII